MCRRQLQVGRFGQQRSGYKELDLVTAAQSSNRVEGSNRAAGALEPRSQCADIGNLHGVIRGTCVSAIAHIPRRAQTRMPGYTPGGEKAIADQETSSANDRHAWKRSSSYCAK